MKSALELLEETNITSLINFSNLQDDVLDEEIINYEIKLLYHSKELGYWSLYFFDFPPYGKEFILETSGEFSEINGTPKTDFVGVFNIFYKTRDNVENNRFTPAVIVFKNKSLSE